MNPKDCHHLIQQLLDGEISAEDFARLDEELRRNPEALAAYRLYAGIHSGLVRKGEIDAAIRSAPVVPIERVMVLQRKKTIRTSLLAAAAVVLLSGLLLWQTIAPRKPSVQATFVSTPGSSFTVSHSADAPAKSRAMLTQGSTIRLDHGAVELSLPHDVRAILEAPATLTLVDDRTVDLCRGRGFFEIQSTEGSGFTVITPSHKIVDIGTAFGVDLPIGSDQTHLHVFKGSVRIDGLDGKETGEVIRAPKSVSILGSKVLGQIDTQAGRFLRSLPDKVENVFVEDFESGLLAKKEYAIHMDPSVIRDQAGNSFAGISEKNPWRFSTSKELRIRNPGFEEATTKGGGKPHWKEVAGSQISTYVAEPKPTEGSQFLLLLPNRTVVQDLDAPIRAGTTYTLTLDIGNESSNPDSQAIVSFFGSVAGYEKPLAELRVDPPPGGWLHSRTLSYTATTEDATGQTLGIALSAKNHWVTFDDLRISETRNIDPAQSSDNLAEKSPPAGPPDNTAPQVSGFNPAPDDFNAPLDAVPRVIFDESARFGTGRIVVKNLTDGSETELIVGSRFTSLRGNILTILPPLGLEDGGSQIGGIPGWETSGTVSRFNPAGNGDRYHHPDLADDSKARGILDSMNGPTLVTLGHSRQTSAIRRPLGKAEEGRIYTVSVGIGHRSMDAAESSTFAGYRIRLLRDSDVLAEVSGKKPPGPPNSITPIGFSWDSNAKTEDSNDHAPLILEISTLEPIGGQSGDLDIDHVKVTSLGGGGN